MDWIKIKDKMPEMGKDVLFYKCMPMGGYDVGVYHGYLKHDRRYFIVIGDFYNEKHPNCLRKVDEFSHWMEIPEVPSYICI
jgi:hypothetical protein